MSKSTQLDHSTPVLSSPFSVRFAETDSMGVVHHSAYIVWFEMGRVAWMDAVGVPYTEIAQSGYHLAVTYVQAAYRASCRFGDAVVVAAFLEQLRSRQVSFRYEIRHATEGTLLVTGSSTHICVDLDGAMARLPRTLLDRLVVGSERLQDGQLTDGLVSRQDRTGGEGIR